MPSLFLFNPETDYALAADSEFYMPPANVVQIRCAGALVQAPLAHNGDAILILDNPEPGIPSLPGYEAARDKGIEVVTLEYLRHRWEQYARYSIKPWGWNRQIRRLIREVLGDSADTPNDRQLDDLRKLSHRRTSILLLEEMHEMLAEEIEIPMEITSADEGMRIYESRRSTYFKAPWSSSGRGIMLTADLEQRHVEPWLRGIIRRQGSVMAEKAYNRRMDFATEWVCSNGKASFLGYSIFKTSRRGKYHSNIIGSQSELYKLIQQAAPDWSYKWISTQQSALEKVIAPEYDGPLGIDMLVTESGAINPCVEINLRQTMGMTALPAFNF